MRIKRRCKKAAIILIAYAIFMYFSLRTKPAVRITDEKGYQSIKASFMVVRKACAKHTNSGNAYEMGSNSQ